MENNHLRDKREKSTSLSSKYSFFEQLIGKTKYENLQFRKMENQNKWSLCNGVCLCDWHTNLISHHSTQTQQVFHRATAGLGCIFLPCLRRAAAEHEGEPQGGSVSPHLESRACSQRLFFRTPPARLCGFWSNQFFVRDILSGRWVILLWRETFLEYYTGSHGKQTIILQEFIIG